jgi:hypothetical protein
MGVAYADKTEAERDAAMLKIPTVEDIVAGNYDRADKELAEGEEQYHLGEVPKVKKTQRKTGQKRPGSSKQGRRRRGRDAADDAEAEVNDALATGLDPKDRKRKKPKRAAATKKSFGGATAAASNHDTTDSGSSSSDDDDDDDTSARKRGNSKKRSRGQCSPREEDSEGDEDEDEDEDEDSDEPAELVELRDVLLSDAELIAAPAPAADDDQRPALQIGQRVKVSANSVVYASENWPGLTIGSSKGPILNAVHGVIRAEQRRQYMVQWFGDECQKRLYACPAARIYALLDREWDREVEKRYDPIEK